MTTRTKEDRFTNANLYLIEGIVLNTLDQIANLLLREHHFSREERRKLHNIISNSVASVTPAANYIRDCNRQVDALEAKLEERR